MHKEVKKFLKYTRRETRSKYWRRSFFRFKKVLEVGSHNKKRYWIKNIKI